MVFDGARALRARQLMPPRQNFPSPQRSGFVMRGLDPRIHPLRKILAKSMHCRVKARQ
jgi:hypothetical protein